MEIWEAVAQSVNMSADACRKRWKGLRDTYKKRKRSELLASGSGAPNPSKKWKYMELLSFLDDYADSRPTVGNIEPEILFEDLADCSTSTIVDADASVPSLNQRKETKKKADAEVTSVFKDVMQECSDAIKELTSVTNPPEKVRNTTSLLFESLANRISKASCPKEMCVT
ncbi:uncharacterized protein LOC118738647 [Rhagoletis pomonella]|uniref:uncharacterized protein LOC118738647 n=1 Tax=Rhagoletis pomonella TaxID=28610 RepID=UPI001786E227|nr:uncharacterized protein LOC118738647 [Rhagoletis pomonella]